MKALKHVLTGVAVLIIIGLILLIAGSFPRLLITGSRMLNSVGEIEIPYEEQIDDEEEIPSITATWPPGDDPSWSMDMPMAPVDKTVEELAGDLENAGS